MIRQTLPRVHPRRIRELFRNGTPGYWTHPEWETRFPWMVQGTTGRAREGAGSPPMDFGLFTEPPALDANKAWKALGDRLGFWCVIHSRQVHGREVLVHGSGRPSESGFRLNLASDADGHLTGSRGLLLGITVADCVPVFLVAPKERVVGLIHAGWRGLAAGVLEAGIQRLARSFAVRPQSLLLHLGPAICGSCYEVGPEVHKALGAPEVGEPLPVDLREILASRAMGMGVKEDDITQSSWCTRCAGSPFFSHRRGQRGRQVGFLGIRP